MPDFSPCGSIVDFLRSCYTTAMRFYPDAPNLVTAVNWFFCDDGVTRAVPATMFCSRNYDDTEDGALPLLGEDRTVPRPWRDGGGPPVPLSNKPCGPEDRWIDGSPPPGLVPAPALAWGVPLCCHPTSGPERLTVCDMGIDTAIVAYALATAANAIHNSNTPFFESAVDELLGPGATKVHGYHPPGILPCWGAAWNSQQAVVVVGGTNNEAALIGQCWASLGGATPQGGFNMNAFSAALAQGVSNEVYAAGLPPTVPCAFVGYSLGGSCVDYVAARMRQEPPPRDCCVLSLGAPRFGGAGLPLLLNARHLNIGRENDLVPFYPPDPAIYLALVSFLFPTIYTPWLSYRYTSSLRQFLPDGSVAPSGGLLPSIAAYGAAIVFWAESFIALLTLAHSIGSYCGDLKIAAAGDTSSVPSSLIDRAVLDAINAALPP